MSGMIGEKHCQRKQTALEKSLATSCHGATMTLIQILIAVFLPPVAAFLKVGFGLHFWLNCLLTLLMFFPGMIHALWLIARK